MWDTSLKSLMFGRMVDTMRDFFTIVGFITLALGGIGVMNIMLVAVKERTREIGVRKALGATTGAILRQFFLEGFFLTLMSGGCGMLVALGLCAVINLAPMPDAIRGDDPVAGRRPCCAVLARRHRRRDGDVSRAPRRRAAAGRGAAFRDVSMTLPCPPPTLSQAPAVIAGTRRAAPARRACC